MRRLGITGANGFVGSALRKRAVVGWDVVSVARTIPGERSRNDLFRIIDDPWSADGWADVFEDVDCVVHLVSRAHHVGEGAHAYDDYYRDNVLVSDALMEGLALTTVRKVVYLSSIKAVGEQTDGTLFDANTMPAPTTPYGWTKLETEDRFARWAADMSKDLIILRPPLAYGPGVKGNFGSMLRVANSGIPLPIGSIANRRSMIHLDNLCDVILLSASDEVHGTLRVPVADREVFSTPEVVAILRAAMGRRPGIFRFPEGALSAISRVAGLEGQFRRISDDLVIDGSVAAGALGWIPARTAIQGLVETAQWYSDPSKQQHFGTGGQIER